MTDWRTLGIVMVGNIEQVLREKGNHFLGVSKAKPFQGYLSI